MLSAKTKSKKPQTLQDFNSILNWDEVSNGTGEKRAETKEPRQKLDWGGHAQISIVDTQPIIHLSLENFFSFWYPPFSRAAAVQAFAWKACPLLGS